MDLKKLTKISIIKTLRFNLKYFGVGGGQFIRILSSLKM